jgi:hypothetical protein
MFAFKIHRFELGTKITQYLSTFVLHIGFFQCLCELCFGSGFGNEPEKQFFNEIKVEFQPTNGTIRGIPKAPLMKGVMT